MARYIIVSAEGVVLNACEWDGIADWSPPDGCTAVKHGSAQTGDTYIHGVVTPAPVPEPVPPTKTFEELVAEATSFDDLKALVLANARP